MRVTLYSKPGCHLCDVTKADLVRLQDEMDFEIQERNILHSPAEFQRYQYLIPVVDVENGPLLHAPIDYLSLFNTLRAAQQASHG